MFIYTFALFWLAVAFAIRYIYSYWDRNGLPSIKPHIPYGNLKAVANRTESFGVATCDLYWKSKDRLVGIYLFFRPAVLIRDAHLAQQIMTTDFSHFHDRGVFCNEEVDPFSANLFALAGKRWRNLRNKFTPLFTAGQLRCMMPIILSVGHKLQNVLEPAAKKQEVLEIRELVSRCVLDIIASVFFGFEANCINDPNDAFIQNLRELQYDGFFNNLRAAASFICPELLKLTRISSLSPEMIRFVTDIVTKQIEHREKNKVTRKDFIQLLIDLRREDTNNNEAALGFEECAANVFLFYVAGSDTSTSAVAFTLHELTQNAETMGKLQTEIDEMLVKTSGELTYDGIKEMSYLDLCVKETLRKYPGLAILNRECTKSYAVPNSDILLKKGTQVVIPLLAYGMDEKYFPEPDRYLPERFDKSTKNYDEKAFYPFGEGPRNCIAFRMGVMVSKICLVLLLSRFNFEATRGPKIDFTPSTVALLPKGGIPVKISIR
ncbi:AAEL009131-PA [Aedes aegypti]|uniref:AAEL009131-PA n=2 Tax=Aedes aegypti TaxID=7159 RepID=A0A1S4FLF6_AEDAE|nr:cytochrome P450 6d3 [Aedes aegypti]EAT39047.1 AAEL009131-PA [Aedes aegypti]